MRNLSISILLVCSLLVCSTSGQFFVDWSDHMMDIVETPFVRTENLIIDAKVYEYVDLNEVQQREANLRQLEEMVQRDDQRFRDMIIQPAAAPVPVSAPAPALPSHVHLPPQPPSAPVYQPQPAVASSNLDKIQSQLHHWEHNRHSSHPTQETEVESSITTPLLLLLILLPIVFSALLGAAICMVRRRRSLGRQEDDDEERLLKPRGGTNQAEPSELKRRLNNLGNSALLKPKNWVNIIKRSPVEKNRGGDKDISPADDYQELCRQRMESNTDKCSPISSTLCASQINTPGLSGINTSTINSTPIRITNEGKSSNSSDSERNSS